MFEMFISFTIGLFVGISVDPVVKFFYNRRRKARIQQIEDMLNKHTERIHDIQDYLTAEDRSVVVDKEVLLDAIREVYHEESDKEDESKDRKIH